MTDTAERWWESHDNIVTLAYWMAEHHWDVHEMALMVEKPWKYTDEWAEAQAELLREEAT